MTDSSRTMTATLIGAVLGAIAGFLLFTDRGRRLRRQIDHALDEVVRERDRTRRALHAVVAAVDEGGTLLGEQRVEEPPPQGSSASTVGASPP